MKLKPKSTTLNPKALLYRRFIGLEKSESLGYVYNTTSDGRFWTFSNETQEFSVISTLPSGSKTIAVIDFKTILQYKENYYLYNGSAWVTTSVPDTSDEEISLLSARFNNIAKYQMNKYYYVGSFDYTIRGSISGTTSQYLKGNIIPLNSLNIKYFDDEIGLQPDDLVVIDKHLYSVEDPETDEKHMPRNFNIYFATLNSIL